MRSECSAERSEIQRRQLKDGSQHDVLKVYYTPDQLARVLAPLGRVHIAEWTDLYFAVGQIEKS